MTSTVADLLPALGLRVVAGPVELRGLGDLDAEEVTSGAFTDNPASLAVSRKVGYRLDGQTRLRRRQGELAVNQQLVLRPDDLVRGEQPVTVEGLPAFRRAIGLDAASPKETS